MDAELPTALGERATQLLLAGLGIGSDVFAHEDRVGVGFARDVEALGHDVASSDDEPASQFAQRSVEVGERFEQEGQPVRGAERAEDRIVEDEQRHDRLGFCGGDERRMIVDSKIACEEDDCGSHAMSTVGAQYGVPASPWPST